jgi:UDP:flavonoid glycosyltransferase YjiC (YdhE family)
MSEPIRIVLAGHAATGHLYPLLSLAEALRTAGHAVTFVTTTDSAAWLEGLGYPVRTAGDTIWSAVTAVQAQAPELTTVLPPEQAWRLDAELFGSALPRSNTVPLTEVLAEVAPDLVVYESANLGALLAATRLGIPAVCLDLWAIGRWHVPRTGLALRISAVWTELSSDPLPVDPLLGVAHLDPSPPSLAVPAADGASRRIPMRQLAWGDPAIPPIRLDDHSTRPLVYLTLGTVGWGTADLFRKALLGISSLAVDVLVAVGSHFDPAELGELGPSVRVERFVRQDQLLPHVAVAVHHGGSGTLLAAATHAVPQLVLPMGADQFQNASALADVGAGRALPHGGVTVDAVRENLAELLADPSYRAAAERLRQEIDALPTPAAVIPDLVKLTVAARR